MTNALHGFCESIVNDFCFPPVQGILNLRDDV
jgi:hypothetical protein